MMNTAPGPPSSSLLLFSNVCLSSNPSLLPKTKTKKELRRGEEDIVCAFAAVQLPACAIGRERSFLAT